MVEAIRYLSTLGSHRVGSSAPVDRRRDTLRRPFLRTCTTETDKVAPLVITLKHHGSK
jgi:hypothetical protein